MRLMFILSAVLLLSSGCGNKTKSGACKDYEPLDYCDDGYVYECETTDDGCKQCGCVPADDVNKYRG